jgi:hypothetical protein
MRKEKAVITVVIAERKFQNLESESNEEREKTRSKGWSMRTRGVAI